MLDFYKWSFYLQKSKYFSLSNNCADGINVQAGKFSKINNCAVCNKCAGWKISFSYQICRLENLQNLLILQDGITMQGEKFIAFLKDPCRNIWWTCNILKLTWDTKWENSKLVNEQVGFFFQTNVQARINVQVGKFSKINNCADWNKDVQAGIFLEINKLSSTIIRETRVVAILEWDL